MSTNAFLASVRMKLNEHYRLQLEAGSSRNSQLNVEKRKVVSPSLTPMSYHCWNSEYIGRK